MSMVWTVELHGGAFDGWKGTPIEVAPEPPEVAVAFRCPSAGDCRGHVTFNAANPHLPLDPEAYRLREADHAARHAIYDLGDLNPELEERLREQSLGPV